MLVVEFLAEYIASERTPFNLVVADRLNLRICRVDTTLQNMALVHRSWTAIAQRASYRRIIVSGVRNMRALLQSTLLGPWVRELSITGVSHVHELQCSCFDDEDQDIVRITCSILERCPNVQALVLDDMQLECGVDNWSGPHSTYHQIGNLTRLKDVWLHSILGPRGSLWNLCEVLPHLLSLSRLRLCDWYMSRDLQSRDNQQIEASLKATQPSQTLQTVSLIHVPDTEKDALAWLLGSCQPQIRLELSAMDISSPPNVPSMNLLHIVVNSKPQITQLTIREPTFQCDIAHVVGLFPTLKTLRVVLNYMWPSHFVLPQSVQSLQLHFEEIAKGDVNGGIVRLLEASPTMKDLLVTYDPDIVRVREGFFLPLTTFCVDKNIRFQLLRVTDCPSIF